MTDIKKTRTARQPESITKGALALELKDRVALVKELQASIIKEVADLTETAKAAQNIANGTGS